MPTMFLDENGKPVASCMNLFAQPQRGDVVKVGAATFEITSPAEYTLGDSVHGQSWQRIYRVKPFTPKAA